ncbi:MAG: phospho-N-acetylmuramoyl-pentapeptide-transferase [Luteibaculaceae bacterium]
MLYHLFDFLDTNYNLPGAGVFQYISFRAGMAVITSLLISLVLGNKLIEILRKKQVGEMVRDLGLDGQKQKQGTPTMGGLIIIAAILIPTLLFANLTNIYVITMLISTVWLGAIGFLDDYIKVFKKNKEGLKGSFKVIGQIGVGLFIGTMLYTHPDVMIKRKVFTDEPTLVTQNGETKQTNFYWEDSKELKTTIPFVKNNEFDYGWLIAWLGDNARDYAWVIFIPLVIFVVTAVSNGANLTDGLDGLAAGSSAIIGVTLAIFAYLSSNIVFADYLNIMFIPKSAELVIFISGFVGACIGFLWHNSYPASVFMGDTGSLALGGIIAAFAISIRKELLIPIFCGIFLIENLSVILQVSYFKYTKKRFGEGRRIFRMSPLHHHYQKLGIHESKIVTRFWIVGIMLAVFSIVTLKLR